MVWNKISTLGGVQASSLATVATTGQYSDLVGKPSIPAAYSLPTASTTVLGGVKVDGTSITIDGAGVISGASTYTLPTASATVKGGVKVGTGVSVDGNGVISVSTAYAGITYPDFLGGLRSAGAGAIASNVAIGQNALIGHASSASGANNVAIGNSSQLNDYATSDNVTIGANAGQNLISSVTGYTVTAGGTGYTASATATISAPSTGGVQATATVGVMSGGVGYIIYTNNGTKYDSTATITINPVGGGSGAVVVPIVSGGSYNVAIGSQALKNGTYTNETVAIGYKALAAVNVGVSSPNTAIGTRALALITSGNSNVAVGWNAASNTNTSHNDMTVIGAQAGINAATSGTFVGSRSGSSTTGTYVTAIGYYAGSSAASNTTWLGSSAGFLNSGAGNVGVGDHVLPGGSGAYSTGVGFNALTAITTGSYNSALGYQALLAATTGVNNTAIGYQALSTLTTSNNNTALGYKAGYNTNGSTSNTTQIGANSVGSGSNNEITLGDSSVSVLRCNSATLTSFSDARDKQDIESIPYALDFIDALDPVFFIWNMRKLIGTENRVGVKDSGFIAQALDKAQKDFGFEEYLKLVFDVNPERLEASYARLLPIMVRGMKDLIAENKVIKARLDTLEGLL